MCAAAAEDGCGYGMAGQRCERESEWVGGCVASVRYRAPGRALYRLNRSACAPGLSPPLISSSFGRQDLPLPESLSLVHRHDSPARPRRLPSPPSSTPATPSAVWPQGRFAPISALALVTASDDSLPPLPSNRPQVLPTHGPHRPLTVPPTDTDCA